MSGDGLGITEAPSGKLLLTGFASVFDTPYLVRDSVGDLFEETICRGAFARSLNSTPPPNVVLLENHAGALLARTRSPNPDKPPNLRLSEKDRGLYVEAELDASLERVKDLRSQVEHSGVEWSFSFQINADTWSEDFSKRYVKDVSQNSCDVTICPFGANPATAGATVEPRTRELSSTVQQRSAYAETLKGTKERRMCPSGFDVPILGETRSGKYAAHELAELGGKGEAYLNPDGHWSFPTRDRDDWEKAKDAVGRSGASHNGVRKYLIGRAKALGLSHLVPDNWAPSGALRSLYLFDIEAELARINELRARPSSWGSRTTIENDSLESCGLCSGSGVIREGNRLCPDCKGTGKIAKAKGKGKARSKDWMAVQLREEVELAALRR
jgi:HK97 family phage prohead protease